MTHSLLGGRRLTSGPVALMAFMATMTVLVGLSWSGLASAAKDSPRHTAQREVCHAQLAQRLAANLPFTLTSKLPTQAVCHCTQDRMAQEPADVSDAELGRRMEAHQAACMQPHVKRYTAEHVTRQFSAFLQRERGWSTEQVAQLADCMGERHAAHLLAHPGGDPADRDGMADWRTCTERAGKAGEPLPLLKAP